jgi:hypothetical protein
VKRTKHVERLREERFDYKALAGKQNGKNDSEFTSLHTMIGSTMKIGFTEIRVQDMNSV